MNHILRILSLILTLATANNLYAQVTPAWTRQLTPAHWRELSRGVVLPRAKGAIAPLDLSRRLAAAEQVKTTDQNWLKHKVFYSGLFSKQEKDILLTPTYARATLGKVVYLHNKHAAFYNQLTNRNATQYISKEAFEKHQQILQELIGTLQQYYVQQHPAAFASDVFSEEEIRRLQTLPAQPTAYVLTSAELAEFTSLPSHQAQQNWTQRKLNTATWETENLLLKQTDTMTPAEFEKYYHAHMRLSYFKLLAQVLQRAEGKRVSAMVRYKLPLNEGETPLTDAQRGGKLLFELSEQHPQFQTFEQNYGPYAAAEALGAPYKIALQYGANAPELLGIREGERLRQLSPQECLREVLPKIAQLENQLTQLRTQPPTDDSFYKTYYGVHAQIQIYQMLAVRARVMLHL